VLGDKNGPVRIKTFVELGGTKKAGNGGNKTQAIALHLINRLLKPLLGYSYHVFLDNLFVFTKMVEYARSISIAITSTCKDTGGVI
jgi:3'-phosphoadenosine 5'-phosphosulfate sulfotransferase (PAPS reductase)/FAD synthetase